jgi:hypothetical protein
LSSSFPDVIRAIADPEPRSESAKESSKGFMAISSETAL